MPPGCPPPGGGMRGASIGEVGGKRTPRACGDMNPQFVQTVTTYGTRSAEIVGLAQVVGDKPAGTRRAKTCSSNEKLLFPQRGHTRFACLLPSS